MKRVISKIEYNIQLVDVDSEFDSDATAWLEKQANDNKLQWLLTHHDDGVIWGELRDVDLHLSNVLSRPILCSKTLQMARLFDRANGELFLWRSNNGWKARLVKEGEGILKEYYDETQLLWGKEGKGGIGKRENGFVLLHQGAEGLRHAPPSTDDTAEPPFGLTVRHFVDYDKDGQAFVEFSRLLSVAPLNPKGEA